MTRAYVGLGSNLGDREQTLIRALELLAGEPDIELVAVSSFRETAPWGYEDQPPFVNAAAAVETGLGPRALLEHLLAVEQALGRMRGKGPKYGPRTVDLDLLLYGTERLEEPGLVLPHPRLHERAFALEPLAELDPALEVPGKGKVQTLLAGLQ